MMWNKRQPFLFAKPVWQRNIQRSKWSVGFALVLLLGLLGCQKLDEPLEDLKRSERPSSDLQGKVVLEERDKGVLRWQLRAERLVRWTQPEAKSMIYGMELDVMDSTGKLDAWVRADSARLKEDGRLISAYGAVRLRSPKQLEISTDTLYIDRPANAATTDSRVRVITPEGDVLLGVGLRSDLKLENWKLQSNVRAIFQNLGPRVGPALEDTTPKSSSGMAASQASPSPAQSPKANLAPGANRNPALDATRRMFGATPFGGKNSKTANAPQVPAANSTKPQSGPSETQTPRKTQAPKVPSTGNQKPASSSATPSNPPNSRPSTLPEGAPTSGSTKRL